MASVGHIAVGMVAARLYHEPGTARRTLVTSMAIFSILSLLPDADVIGFRLGVAYGDPWGHRGATHSFAFALALGAVAAALAPLKRLPVWRTAIATALVVGSHGVLDAFTDGGLGIGLLWPFDLTRYFAPISPLPVAPIGRRFFSEAGLSVLSTELVLFAPAFLYALWPRGGLSLAARPDAALEDE